MDSAEAMRLLRVDFPELAAELDDATWAGLLHVEFGCLARYTKNAIEDGERAVVARCFEFARRASLLGNHEVINAIGVSFMGHLDFNDGKVKRGWAFEMVPPILREVAIEAGLHRRCDVGCDGVVASGDMRRSTRKPRQRETEQYAGCGAVKNAVSDVVMS